MNYTFADALENLESAGDYDVTTRARDKGAEAIAFAMALHEMFKSNGMTSKEEPDLDELENLVDALHGELAAAVLFLCENSFARVPDMMRVVSATLEKDGTAPVVVAKGYARLAKRIENTRVMMQKLAPASEKS